VDGVSDDARSFTLSAYIFPSSPHLIYTNQPKTLVTSVVAAGRWVKRMIRRLEMDIEKCSAERDVSNLGERREDSSVALPSLASV
jgi:hypothetical protein